MEAHLVSGTAVLRPGEIALVKCNNFTDEATSSKMLCLVGKSSHLWQLQITRHFPGAGVIHFNCLAAGHCVPALQ